MRVDAAPAKPERWGIFVKSEKFHFLLVAPLADHGTQEAVQGSILEAKVSSARYPSHQPHSLQAINTTVVYVPVIAQCNAVYSYGSSKYFYIRIWYENRGLRRHPTLKY